MVAVVAAEVRQPLAAKGVRAGGVVGEVEAVHQRLEVWRDHPFLEGPEELERRRLVATECFQVAEVAEVEQQEDLAPLDTSE